jgi:L-lactate dehydrogenase
LQCTKFYNFLYCKKGATYYAVALAVNRIVETIVRDEHSILTVSSVLDGEYNIKNISISVPTIVSKSGIENVLEIKLKDNEQNSLEISANSLKKILEKIQL